MAELLKYHIANKKNFWNSLRYFFRSYIFRKPISPTFLASVSMIKILTNESRDYPWV
jgi:hypothetical protein